jgi:hypothetical protein
MRMPFGRFKGVLIGDLPDDYLEWLRGLDNLREPLRDAVEAEWAARFAAPDEPTIDPAVRAMASEIVSVGYRQLAMVHHPDRGGSHTAMTVLNAAATWLRQVVRR